MLLVWGHGESDDRPLAERQAAIALEMTAWKSIELRVKYHQTFYVKLTPGDPASELEHHYIETSYGRRFYDMRIPVSVGKVSRQAAFSDGKRCARVSFEIDATAEKQSEINISKDFLGEKAEGYTQRPHPMQLM
jgi:hypothetical protein